MTIVPNIVSLVQNQKETSLNSPLTEDTVLKGTACDKGRVIRQFEKVARARMTLELLRMIMRKKVMMPEVEAQIKSSQKTNKCKSKVKVSDMSNLRDEIMRSKVKDAKDYLTEVINERKGMMKKFRDSDKIKECLKNKVISQARQKERRIERQERSKHTKKIEHLKEEEELKNMREEMRRELPTYLMRYKNLRIFTEDFSNEDLRHKQVKVPERETQVVGAELSPNELKVLQLPPKHCLLRGLADKDMEIQIEVANCKARYGSRDDQKDGEDDDEEVMMNEDETKRIQDAVKENEARSRVTYLQEENTLSLARKKVTDLPQNSKVHLPGPIAAKHEVGMAMRRDKYLSIFNQYVKTNCNSRGEQPQDLGEELTQGLKSLKKRVGSGELVITETDKTSNFFVCSQEVYKQLGEVHTRGDEEVTWEQADRIQHILNGHTSMWCKMTGLGSNWGQEARMRETLINHTVQVPTMSLLVKDHKDVPEGALPPTRPVVSGCSSMNRNISDILSEVLEPVARQMEGVNEFLSTEESLNMVDQLNTALGRAEEAGHPCNKEDLCIVGADVKALYPSLDAYTTGETIRREIIRSPIEFTDLEWKEMARYVAFTSDPHQHKSWGVHHLIPKRRFKYGRRPGITGADPLSADIDSEEQWVFPRIEPTQSDKRKLLAAAAGVAVTQVFRLHLYKFGGRLFQQLRGGPIGLRVTACAARIRVGAWIREMQDLLTKSGIKVLLCGYYVDDIRIICEIIPYGFRWEEKERRLMFREEWEQEDKLKHPDKRVHTAQTLLPLFNGLNKDLQFTVETEADFPTNKIPTLDYEMWLGEHDGKPRILYQLYRKPMSSVYVTLETNASSWNSKVATVSQEVVRASLNTSEHLPQQDRDKVIESVCDRIKSSGYSWHQIHGIVMSGLKGYEGRRMRAAKESREVHRTKEQMNKGREVKMMISKANWFTEERYNYQELLDQEDRRKETAGVGEFRRRRQGFRRRGKGEKTITVVFIPRTNEGTLVSKLRRAEEELAPFVGQKKFKLIEEQGVQLRRLLIKKDPWSEMPCGRHMCTACRNLESKPKPGSCRTRSVVYSSYCIPCKQEGAKTHYIGESARSTYERGLEHLGDATSSTQRSHMRDHLEEAHPGEDRTPESTFCIRIMRSEPSALVRQVSEAVEIARAEGGVWNKKEEYNRCLLPSLRVDPGWQKPQLPSDVPREPSEETLLHGFQQDRRKRHGQGLQQERDKGEPKEPREHLEPGEHPLQHQGKRRRVERDPLPAEPVPAQQEVRPLASREIDGDEIGEPVPGDEVPGVLSTPQQAPKQGDDKNTCTTNDETHPDDENTERSKERDDDEKEGKISDNSTEMSKERVDDEKGFENGDNSTEMSKERDDEEGLEKDDKNTEMSKERVVDEKGSGNGDNSKEMSKERDDEKGLGNGDNGTEMSKERDDVEKEVENDDERKEGDKIDDTHTEDDDTKHIADDTHDEDDGQVEEREGVDRVRKSDELEKRSVVSREHKRSSYGFIKQNTTIRKGRGKPTGGRRGLVNCQDIRKFMVGQSKVNTVINTPSQGGGGGGGCRSN